MAPRPVVAKGRPTYPRLISPQWATYGAAVAEEAFTSVIKIAYPPTRGEYNEETHSYPTTPGAVLYQGPGRIQSIGAGDESTVDNAGQQVTITRYRVSYPLREELAPVGTVVEITDESIKITGVDKVAVSITAYNLASQAFQTDVLVESNQG